MNTKTKAGIGIAMVLLMVAALAAPAAADYAAEDTKMNIYKTGSIRGDLSYTSGDEFYQCIMGEDSAGNGETATYNINLPSEIPIEDIKEARLYVYWTWSLADMCDKEDGSVSTYKDYAVYPELEVEFNGVPVSFDYAAGTNRIDHYTDSKAIDAVGLEYFEAGYQSFNFPSGTDPSAISKRDVQASNVVNVTNVYPYQGPIAEDYCPSGYAESTGRGYVCIQGVGLLVAYKTDGYKKKYWVAEGNDMTYVKYDTRKDEWSYGITPDMATTKVTFPGYVPFWMNKATLTSVIPAGDTSDNRLYFNNFNNYWTGLWAGIPDPNLAVSVTDVSDNLLRGWIPRYDNVAGFQNGLYPPDTTERQMNVATAILVVEHDSTCLDMASAKEMKKVGGLKNLQEEL